MEIPVKGSRIPYLDGLRAYSILLVVLAHASDAQAWLAEKPYLRVFLPDAALGVRILFVLSRFLIAVNLHMLRSHAGASMQAAEFGHFWTLSICNVGSK
jgi:peptidoglycan/LPS O-acetylase OafA/YrhL